MTSDSNGEMGKGDRDELAKLVRRREKLAKAAASQRATELEAEFERQMATIFSWDDDEVWRRARAVVEEATEQANAVIDKRCAELGIPEQFRPSIYFGWSGRSESATKDRRAELRKVAKTRIAASERAAKVEIERRSLEVQTVLVAGGLASGEAQAFLESMPTAEQLMPPLAVPELEQYAATIAREER